MTTGFVWHESYMWHDTGHATSFIPSGGWLQADQHVENPESKRRLKNLLDVSGMTEQLHRIAPRPASEETLSLFHTRDHIEAVRALSATPGSSVLGENCVVGPGSYEIATLAVGGVIEAFGAVARGEVANAYALVRPPGHHAERDQARGFCLFNNVSVAVKHLMASGQARRVAIVDWDVHHGNGTQQAFYSDPDVLTISVHQDRNYPQDCGFINEHGEGEGHGTNINVPLPAGSGRGAYVAAVKSVVLPALRAFAPDFIVISSGYDAAALDPMAHMMLYSDVYRELTLELRQAADELAEGRLVMVHEGGYSAPYVPFCGLAAIEALSGISTEVQDPFADYLSAFGGQEVQPHQAAIIEQVCEQAPLLVRSGVVPASQV